MCENISTFTLFFPATILRYNFLSLVYGLLMFAAPLLPRPTRESMGVTMNDGGGGGRGGIAGREGKKGSTGKWIFHKRIFERLLSHNSKVAYELFKDEFSHLYEMVCPFVRPSIGKEV